ncbi:Elongation of very long chain fatty acids protein 7 [Blomia tropicalis]|nr:Elongation of very long chain fatty acids protein 7 [Blomia tropicalis]
MKISDLDYIFEYIGMSHDPRTHHLLPVNVSPFFVIWLIINWVLFTKSLGPAIMKNRQPYELRTPMFFYNCLMTWINIYSVYKVISLSNYFRVLFDVEYPDRNDMSEHSINLIHLGYLYWLTKLTDCFDTLFFVLRKKYDQITLLHVYHHTVVPLFGYLLLRINPLLPACFLFAMVNSTIHVIMYSYYALAALGPSVQKYLWWKKYITMLQLWQFVLYGIYGFIFFFVQKNYPIFWMYFALTQPPLFFWLFYDFYIKSYIQKSRQKKAINKLDKKIEHKIIDKKID